MGSSPYIWKINSKLQGNTIESRDIAEVRRDIINDIRRLKTVIDNHASEVEDIYFMADNTMLLPDGYWSHGTPDGLSRQAMELEDHYERMDYNAKQSLFADIFSADREVSQSGIYEKRDRRLLARRRLLILRYRTNLIVHLTMSTMIMPWEISGQNSRLPGRSKIRKNIWRACAIDTAVFRYTHQVCIAKWHLRHILIHFRRNGRITCENWRARQAWKECVGARRTVSGERRDKIHTRMMMNGFQNERARETGNELQRRLLELLNQ